MKLPRFYPIVDAATVRRMGLEPVNVALQILEAGATIVQYRDKAQVTRGSYDVMMRINEIAKRFGAIFVVNDRADLAKNLGAALHLGQDDLHPAAARRVTGPDTIVGFSTHNEAQLRAGDREPVNYLALGPMFGATSKENPDPVAGIDELRRVRALTSKPLVAIGGITRANARSVIEAGADSVAIIRDLFPEDGAVYRRAAEWIELLRT
jgi:thiamine-phosphate pyrophosphorylase